MNHGSQASLRIGSAQVDRVEEQRFPVPLLAMTDDVDFIARRIAPLPRGFLDPDTMTFQFTCQSWIIRVDGRTVLVDPCNGNGRSGRHAPVFNDLDTPYLERLAGLGAPAEAIDIPTSSATSCTIPCRCSAPSCICPAATTSRKRWRLGAWCSAG